MVAKTASINAARKENRGGKREGAGRPKGTTGTKYPITPAVIEQRSNAATVYGGSAAKVHMTRRDREAIKKYERALLAELPWATSSDALAIRQLAKLLLRQERIDAHLSQIGEIKEGDANRLASESRQLDNNIRAWSDRLGLNTQARANLGLTVAQTRAAQKTLSQYLEEKRRA